MFDETSINKKDRDVTRREREIFIIETIRKNQPIHYNQLKEIVVHESNQMPTRIFDNIMKDLRKRELLIETRIGRKIYFAIPGSVKPINVDKFIALAKQANRETDEFLRRVSKVYPKLPFREKAEIVQSVIGSLLGQSLIAYLLSLPHSKETEEYREISNELRRRVERMVEIIFSDKDADAVYCLVLLNTKQNLQPGKDDALGVLKLISSTQQFKHLE